MFTALIHRVPGLRLPSSLTEILDGGGAQQRLGSSLPVLPVTW